MADLSLDSCSSCFLEHFSLFQVIVFVLCPTTLLFWSLVRSPTSPVNVPLSKTLNMTPYIYNVNNESTTANSSSQEDGSFIFFFFKL